MAGSFAPVTSGTAAINNILVQEANRIGSTIYRDTLATSPWIDLIRKGTFEDGLGYQQNTLIYGRGLPLNDGNNTGTFNVLGVNWQNVASSALTADNSALNSAALIAGSSIDRVGPRNKASRIDFTKKLKSFNLMRAFVESPRINVDDLRFAAYRQEQLSAVMSILKDSTVRTWEERNRDEYDRLCANIVFCGPTAAPTTSPIITTIDISAGTTYEGTATEGLDLLNDYVSSGVDINYEPTTNISKAVLNKVYMNLIRAGGGLKAYGKENSRPIFGLVISSEASNFLITESGTIDSFRFNDARVSELLAPLGVERSYNGFYHIIDDICPRFNVTSNALVRVRPEVYSGGILIQNSSYDTATHEVAYILHEEVMESLIPNPVSGGAGMTFNPTNFRGDFRWTNIPDEVINPDGTIGFFRGVLASASKPIKTNFGYTILYKRTSTTPATV